MLGQKQLQSRKPSLIGAKILAASGSGVSDGVKNIEAWFHRLVADLATIFELANAVIANRLGRLSTLIAKASRIRVVQKHRNRFTAPVLCLYAETLVSCSFSSP